MKSHPQPWFQPLLRNVTSQFGEDGILEHALATLGTGNGWCVEFGAWDGVHLSNTNNLIVNRGFSAVLIEGDAGRFQSLRNTFAGNQKVTAVNRYVGFDKSSGLDAILGTTPIPREFDVLSIDIDGNDYHVWSALEEYRPRLVVIEYNPSIPSPVDFVQRADPAVTQGCSLAALCRLASGKRYELIAITATNAIFVDGQYFPRFGIQDNSIEALRIDSPAVSYVFQGYDGTIHLAGHDRMIWHGLRLDASRMQQIPRWFRRYPENFPPFTRLLWRLYRKLRRD